MTRFLTVFLFLLFALPAYSAPELEWNIEKTVPHDTSAFTQGLFFHDGRLYESTGQYGESEMRILDPKDGAVVKSHKLDDRYFGEGACAYRDTIIQLTWKSGRIFHYDKELTPLPPFPQKLKSEGWGICSDDKVIFYSDGGHHLYPLLAVPGKKIKQPIRVTLNKIPVNRLNELEWVNNRILANVWQDTRILQINPDTGIVTGVLRLEKIAKKHAEEGVLNGIAWDNSAQQLWITGKNWSRFYVLSVPALKQKQTKAKEQ